MKKLFTSWMLLLLSALSVHAQGFDLYMANNLSDVQNLRRVTRQDSELKWNKITSNTIGGNQVEVQKVKEMFAKTSMKGLEEQKLFWKMRDNTALCFRINDGRGRDQVYDVQVYYNDSKQPLGLGVTGYFFLNLPYATDSVLVKVAKRGLKNTTSQDTIKFRYFAYGWDDENLYTFRLDSKRQKTGLTYQIEYKLTESGKEPVVQTLDVKGDKFQSFYVPEGKTLSEIYLVSNDTGDQRKLKLDRKKLQYGVWLCHDFDRLKLESNIFMDKHEGRELTVFNMLGTGLMERYDILYLRVYAKNGNKGNERVVKNAIVHVERINEKGEYVADQTVKVLGYDSHTQSYKIQTMTNPALIEVLADGYYPAIYKYQGAFDPTTKVLNPEKCNVNLRLFPTSDRTDQIAISGQMMYSLKERVGIVEQREGKSYKVCVIDSVDMAGKSKESDLSFMDDAGIQTEKLLNGQPIEKYAQLAFTLSVPKADTDQSTPQFYATEKGNAANKYTLSFLSRNAILAKDHPSLSRNYYELRYDLVDKLPKNISVKPTIQIGTAVFANFPYLRLVFVNKEEKQEEAKKQAQATVCNDTNEKISEGATDIGVSWMTSPSFKLKLDDYPGFSLNVTPSFDWEKGLLEISVAFSLGAKAGKYDGKDMREQLKKNSVNREFTHYKSEDGKKKITGDFSNQTASLKPEDKNKWFMNEFDDIFMIPGNKLGMGYFLDGDVAFSIPIYPMGFYLKSMNVGAGVGFFGFVQMDPADKLKQYVKNETALAALDVISKFMTFRLSACLQAYLKVNAGVKRYGFKKEWGKLNAGKLGWLVSSELTVKGGVCASISLDPTGADDPKDVAPEDKDVYDVADAVKKLVHIGGKFRIGGKFLATAGLGGQMGGIFGDQWSSNDAGAKLMALIGVDGFFEVYTPILRFRPRFTACFGKQKWYPKNTDNPFYPGYPSWLKNGKQAPAFRVADDQDDIDTDATYFDLGTPLRTNIGSAPSPLFLSETDIVLNTEEPYQAGTEENFISTNVNGDAIQYLSADGSTMTPLSDNNLRATRHSADHAGGYDIVAFEQQKQTIDISGLTNEQLVTRNTEVARSNKLVAYIRQNGGEWRKTTIADSPDVIDETPVVAIQDDGRATAIWKRGQYVNGGYSQDLKMPVHHFKGSVMMSTYDGNSWSQPEQLLLHLDDSTIVRKMQLAMVNDSALAAVHIINYMKNAAKGSESTLWYVSKALTSGNVMYTIDECSPIDISMERVGDEAVIAQLYETCDSLRDIYVKTMNMNAIYSGHGSTDMNLMQFMPQSVKVISDKTVDYPHDFCLLWTRMDNTVRRGKESIGFPQSQTILNASRIFMHDNLRPTPYISVGASRDNYSMTDYDGYLDDLSITVVYGLSDPEDTSKSKVMVNTQEFYNDFEYDISYVGKALINTQTLPVNFKLYNTGTSPITSASFTINNVPYELNDLYVGPYDKQLFTVDYTVPADFNGLLKVDNVSCDFDNVFQASYSKRRGASLRRAVKTEPYQEVIDRFEDISCELVAHVVEGTTNIYEVELTDNSMNGLSENNSVYVGIYPCPTYDIPISDEAVQRITASDFIDVGGERKAYATLYVEQVEETQPAFLNTFIYDERIINILKDDDDPGIAVVDNLSDDDNLWFVQLIASEEDELTGVPLVQKDADHRKALVQREPGGLRISGLTDGKHLRVFAADGKVQYAAVVKGTSQFVALTQRGVYLISTGDEIFKYNY